MISTAYNSFERYIAHHLEGKTTRARTISSFSPGGSTDEVLLVLGLRAGSANYQYADPVLLAFFRPMNFHLVAA
jgi:hypothetical protein